MELKDYQQDVLADLEEFVKAVVDNGHIAKTYARYWLHRGIVLGSNNMSLRPYNDTVPGVPRVTSKVPTAGGKTFIACNAISTIFRNLPEREAKVVAWFVPSDTILEQTLEKLRDVNHPYRRCLDTMFNGRVAIVDKESALNGTDISPVQVREQLTVFVLSAASFIDARRPEGARVYRDNGNLEAYAKLFDSTTKRIASSGETGLIQVISYLNPLVIVDESHNFTADLRVDMLNNINPCFIYELTATPRRDSNIITFVGADKLKRSNMVKLPVIVHNDHSIDAVIANSINLRNNLEAQAKAVREQGGEYIRPIVLFQAQPRRDDDSETFEKIKERLVSQFGIPEEQIKIKTANVNELKGINLMEESCPVRYIITVNALKEGWDCPFAYILASLANRTSRIDVEQILGRILRQPYARKHQSTFLNMSYTFTCSNDFQQTLDAIVEGLNSSGFSAKDYRAAQFIPNPVREVEKIDPTEPVMVENLFDLDGVAEEVVEPTPLAPKHSNAEANVDISDLTELSQEEKSVLNQQSENEITSLLSTAQNMAQQYDEQIAENTESDNVSVSSDVAKDANIYYIADSFRDVSENICIPQFFINYNNNLMDGSSLDILDKESLLTGFDLSTADKNITFDISESATRIIDLDKDKDYTPVQGAMSDNALNIFRKYYMSLNNEGKISQLVDNIVRAIHTDGISELQLREYVRSILCTKNSDELTSLAANLGTTIQAFKNKILDLAAEHRNRNFFSWLTLDKICAEPSFRFRKSLILPVTSSSLPKSLYYKEDHMNPFEFRLIEKVANLDNVLFWHRNLEMKGFCINGYINHYPDFIVVTKGGKIIILEAKGDDRQNFDSANKLNLGNAWAQAAGNKYRYFMVFDNKPMDGAYSMNEFVQLLSQIS